MLRKGIMFLGEVHIKEVYNGFIVNYDKTFSTEPEGFLGTIVCSNIDDVVTFLEKYYAEQNEQDEFYL